jgi:hypothetical protein
MAICTADAEVLSRMLREGPVRVHLWQACRDEGEVESANVVGELVGSEHPEQVVLIGAHLDAWDLGEGAHDDGAGCAHVLEAMRLLLATGYRPRRTIRAVLFMNEENGLKGALGYAARHRAALVGGTHVAAIETDAGGFAPEAFTCSLRGAELAALQKWFEPLRELGMGPLLEGAGGADISVLKEHGTVLFGMGVAPHRYFDFHHSAQDRLVLRRWPTRPACWRSADQRARSVSRAWSRTRSRPVPARQVTSMSGRRPWPSMAVPSGRSTWLRGSSTCRPGTSSCRSAWPELP